MTRKPHYLESEVSSRWMISYMDMVTILLIFFVAVSAQSLNKPTHHPQPKAASAASHGPLAATLRNLEHRGLDVKMEPRGLVISLPQTVLFASGEDQVSETALPIIDQIAEALRDIPNQVSLAGHADAVPIHNRKFRDNWELSTSRSLRLLELLRERYGIPEARLSLASYGSTNPRGPNDTEEGRASNRRVEIVIRDEAAR
jgi:chemotaxis protein MotB